MGGIVFDLQLFANISSTADNTLISGTSGDDAITSYGNNVTINASAGDDNVTYDGSDGVVNLDDGDDYYFGRNGNESAKNIQIYGGAGDDYISGLELSYVTMEGGSGNDSLGVDGGDYNVLFGGAGNDELGVTGATKGHHTVDGGDGNDKIDTYGSDTDNLIYGGSGNDSIGIGSLKSLKSLKSTIYGGSGNDIIRDEGINNYINGGAGNDSIYLGIFGKSVVQFGSGDGNDTVFDFDKKDTLQITSGNIESSVVSGKNLTLKVGDGKITLSDVAGSTLKVQLASGQTMNLTVPDGSSTVSDGDSDADADTDGNSDTVSGGGDSMDGITVSNGTVYINSDFEGDEINLADYPSTVKNINASTFEEDLHLIGTEKNNSLVGGKGDDLIEGGTGRDTLTGGRGDDVFIHTGGKDIITDYTAGEDKIQLENGTDDISKTKFSGSNLIIATATGSITVKGGKGRSVTVVDDQGNEEELLSDVLPKYLTYNANQDMLTAAKKYSGVIDLTAYTQTQNAKTVNAAVVTNNVEIIGNALNNSIIAGSGDDTLYGGRGTDTLTGGSGSDIFMHTSGSDVITDYTVGEDFIQLGEGVEIESAKLNVKDIILTTSTGTITVKEGKNKKITVVDADGDSTAKIYPITKMTGLSYGRNKTVLTVKKTFSGETIELEDYVSTVKTVNAKVATVNVDIIGNKLNNSLIGGAGDDTLGGGEGKDTLTGGKGEDVFVYTAGSDTITDYKPGEDKIQLDDGVELQSWKVNGKNVIFTTSAGKFTVKNGKNKKITIVNEEGDETAKKYSASSSGLLFAEDNFVTADSLSSIVENNSVGEFEFSSPEKLTQENLITFAAK